MVKNSERAKTIILEAGKRWPSTIITRKEINRFTGGVIAPGTLANLDSQKRGIPGAFRIGRTVAYPVDQVCEWLISRLED